jgi:hypothetical protein
MGAAIAAPIFVCASQGKGNLSPGLFVGFEKVWKN